MNLLCPSKVLRNLSAELLNRYGLVHKFKVEMAHQFALRLTIFVIDPGELSG